MHPSVIEDSEAREHISHVSSWLLTSQLSGPGNCFKSPYSPALDILVTAVLSCGEKEIRSYCLYFIARTVHFPLKSWIWSPCPTYPKHPRNFSCQSYQWSCSSSPRILANVNFRSLSWHSTFPGFLATVYLFALPTPACAYCSFGPPFVFSVWRGVSVCLSGLGSFSYTIISVATNNMQSFC